MFCFLGQANTVLELEREGSNMLEQKQGPLELLNHWSAYTIETLFGIVLTLLGWMGYRFYGRVDALESRMNATEVDIAELMSIKKELDVLTKTVNREFNKQEILITTLINKLPS